MRKLVAAVLTAFVGSVGLLAQVPGRNVNMVSGTTLPDGDPFLQRQNEPSIAVSTRNPLHVLGGANDYRTVDLPGLPDDLENGDAWLGIYRSIDGGLTWKTTLLPGYPQDHTAVGLASPIHGFQAGADPTVRAGTNGLFFYSGIAFNRGAKAPGSVFVARFIDQNNKENGNPIAYVGATLVAKENDKKFLDKPWLAVDIPRHDAGMCSINGQKFPTGNVYIVYSMFNGLGAAAAPDPDDPAEQASDAAAKPAELRGTIMFSRSRDCGATWSHPDPISDGRDVNQGATIAIDPATGDVYVAWRQFADVAAHVEDAILVAHSKDGKNFDKPTRVAVIAPFDQGTTSASFRTNAYPTLTVDESGRLYLAWAARGFASLRPSPIDGDSRIVISTSLKGGPWSARRAIDDAAGIPGHQLMPALAYAAGKLQIAYYDLREDLSRTFAPYITDAGLPVRHTIDIRAAQAAPGPVPIFTVYTVTPPNPSAEVSEYLIGSRPGSTVLEQMQFSPPNFPLFKQGTAAFLGDYIDVAPSPAFVPTAKGGWAFNTAKSNTPTFHVAWTDNRDVRPPADHNWAHYTPPTYTGPGLEASHTAVACTPGQTGMRNQNIYTSRITPRLVAGSPGNTKPLTTLLERGFVVFAQNTTMETKSYRLTIDNQPAGGRASFSQFPLPPYTAASPPPLTTTDVRVPARSLSARTVYVTSSNPHAGVGVTVVEVTAPGGPPVTGGDTGVIALNPDITNPDITNPDITNPDITNPDITNAEVENPDITNPDITNPDITNPDITNPDITNPDITNVNVVNPDITNPDITNPDITNPDITNPDITNPDITNPDITNGAIVDYTWTIVNNGNTAAAYSTKLFSNAVVPEGIKLQFVVAKTYTTPVAVDCDLKTVTQNVVIVNNVNPTFTGSTGQTRIRPRFVTTATAQAANPAEALDPDDVTFWLAPGEKAKLTLRVVDTDRHDGIVFDATHAVFPAAQQEAVNSDQAAQGITVPPTVLPPSGSVLAFAVQPSDTPANQTILPAVQVRALNLVGEPVPGIAVTLSLTPSPSALHGTLTAKTNAHGVATFATVRADTAGTYTLTASAVQADVTPVNSAPFTVVGAGAQVCPTPGFGLAPIGAPVAPAALAVGDFDGNGLRDVAVGSGNGVAIFLQTSVGVWTPAGTIAVANAPRHLAAADMDGDGDLDLVVTTGGTGGVQVLTNSGGTFTANPAVALGGLPTALALGDVNGDGVLDALVTTTGADQLAVALGHGDGTFAAITTVAAAISPRQLVLGDYNGDGMLDVAAVLASGSVAILTGNGSGAFSLALTLPVAGGARKLTQGDMNEDGNLDLAVVAADDTVHLILGQGNGVFNESASRTTGAGVTAIALGDFNGDGHLDVATAGTGGLSILVGDAAGNLAAPGAPIAIGATVLSLTTVDINGNGATDLVAGLDSNQLIALVNVCGSGPQITANVTGTAGEPGSGWYRSDVGVTWTVIDPFSTIVSTTGCDPSTLTSETTGQTLTCSATNALGQTASKSVTIKIDKTPPSFLSTTVSPPPNVAGWNKTVPVAVTGSGVDVGPIQSGGVTCTSTTLNGETAGTVVALQCADQAGNTASGAPVTVRIDTTLPSIVFGPSNPPLPGGGVYARDVIIPYTITDALSGVAAAMPMPAYVGDIANHTLYRVDPITGSVVTLYVGGERFSPLGMAISPLNGKVYFAEDDQQRIWRIDQTGENLERVYDSATAVAPNNPTDAIGLAFAPNGDLYFTNSTGNNASAYGVWRIVGGTPGTAPVLMFALPTISGSGFGIGITFAPNGDLYVADTSSNEIVKSSPPYSTYSVFLGPASFPTCTTTNDDAGVALPFCVFGALVNSAGDVFVSHGDAHAILRFDSSGAPLGTFTSFGAPFIPTFAQFDAAGNMWVGTADLFANEAPTPGAVYRVAPDGAQTQVAGTPLLAPLGMVLPVATGNTVMSTVAYTATSAGVAVNATDVAGNAAATTSPAVTIDKSNPPPSSFTVTNTLDSGEGSLRQAIVNANAHPGTDTITFNIQPSGAKTIAPLTVLPDLTDVVILDATTQPGFAGTPIIELSGANAGQRATALQVLGGHSTVRGFVINGWSRNGIHLDGVGFDTVAGNYIGLNAAGTGTVANGGSGIFAQSGDHQIGGTTAADRNVISGNAEGGITLNLKTDNTNNVIYSSAGTKVQGNYVGTNAAGTAGLDNTNPNSFGSAGISVGVPNITIGGGAPGAGNLISGQFGAASAGIFVGPSTSGNCAAVVLDATGVTIQGNKIGTNATGMAKVPNRVGMFIDSPGAHIGGANAGEGNQISGNNGNGIALGASCNNLTMGSNALIEGNNIGLDATGNAKLPAAGTGTAIQDNAPGAMILNNVIAGNGVSPAARQGISVFNDGGFNAGGTATIQGNYIGTNAAGAAGLGNTGAGVALTASNNTVGGSTPAARNVIAGNGGSGVSISANTGQTASNNIVRGNYIGTMPSGTAALSNTNSGIGINRFGTGVLTNNTIDGNVISGNTLFVSPATNAHGISVNGGDTLTVTGNYIGTDKNGTIALANSGNGVQLTNVTNSTVGGTTAAARNVIAGNTVTGVSLGGTASGNVVAGNYIGVDVSGSTALANSGGVSVNGTASGNTIGGAAAGAGNVISGNTGNGINLNTGTTTTTVQGNRIGTNAAGTAAVANTSNGINVSGSSNNTVGGTSAAARNIIGGNGGYGVNLSSPSSTTTSSNTVAGNYIGTDVTGAAAVANGLSGVGVNSSGGTISGNTIGGTAAGAGNVLSGNNTYGVFINAGTTTTVQGNFIGTNAAGSAALKNNSGGVIVFSSSNTIGGTTAGARNVIAGNNSSGAAGISISGTGNSVLGNVIGTNPAGTAAIANYEGVLVNGANNTIGGTASGAGNLISGNTFEGVYVNTSASGTLIQGNLIGTNAAGTAAIGNGDAGVYVFGPNNTIGGTAASARNVISGNVVDGVTLQANANTVLGNYVGTNAAGTGALGNGQAGVHIFGSNNVVGGTGAGAGNVISANPRGVLVSADTANGYAATGNQITGNYIGTDPSGTAPLGNTGSGVEFSNGASTNTVGGTGAGAGNTIAFNGGRGVNVGIGTGTATGNSIRGNSIVSNTGIGIDLGSNGVTANDLNDGDTGANNLQNFPVITSARAGGGSTFIDGTYNSFNGTFALDFYANVGCDPSGFGEGQRFLGSVSVTTVGNNGSFSAALASASSVGEFVTATATDFAGNTSEFSQCQTVTTAATADVSLAMSRAPATPTLAQPLTYTMTVSNAGPAAAPNVVVTDPLPAGVAFVGVASSQGACSLASGTITCNLGTIANGATATVTIDVTPTVAAPLTNNASVSASAVDPNGANNTASDVSVVASFGPCSAATFSGLRTFTVGASGATVMTTGDFNKDGKMDIAVSEGSTNTIAVFLGDGAGGFGAPTHFTVGNAPNGLIAADFNKDGKLDLAVANNFSNSISILLGDGVGGFGPANTISVLTSPFNLEAADFNKDGNLDIVVSYSQTTSTNVSVLLGNGTGGFSAPTSYPSGQAPVSVIVGDFDGNGTLDIAVPNSGTNTISILGGDGSGGFAAPATITMPNTVSRLRRVGDLSGDGKPDLGVTTLVGGTNNMMILLTNNTGGFNAAYEVLAPPYAVGFGATGDVTGDGKVDLVAISSQAGLSSILVAPGNGDGTFRVPASFLIGQQNNFNIVDLNGDGRPDLIGVGPTANTFYVLLNNCGVGSATDLAIGMTGPATASAGDTVNYSLTVTNNSPNTATGVVVSDFLPAGSEFVGVSSPTASCGHVDNGISCTLASLAASGTATVSVDARITSGGTRTNRAMVLANEPDSDGSNNNASVATIVAAGPVTLTVTNVFDTGVGSMRQVINDANLDVGATVTIAFAIGSGAQTITPFSALPAITVPVIIDGTTQPGFSGTPLIELSGSTSGGASGLRIQGGNSTVRGLIINRFGGPGISISTNGGNTVAGNIIGTNAAGAGSLGNTGNGVSINTSNNVVGGATAADRNVISGNGIDGVGIFANAGQTATGNQVLGNYLGLTPAGTAARPNAGGGVTMIGQGGTVDTTTVSGNVVSGNSVNGVLNSKGGVATMVGNLIGTNAAGTAAIANGFNGVLLTNVSSNIVGGTTASARNIISGNNGAGVTVTADTGFVANGNTILGNYIGTNASGTGAIANTNTGINVTRNGTGTVTNTVIGGTTAGAGNVLSGNVFHGIGLFAGSDGTTVQGNFIGTNNVGTAAIPNGSIGISIQGSSNHTIGGSTTAARNVISGNVGRGIEVFAGNGQTSSDTTIRGNYIGVTASGAAALGNGNSGIGIGPTGTGVTNNTVVDGNVISGNTQNGIQNIAGGVATITGNLIGTNAAGTAALGNTVTGVLIFNAAGNTIGGTTAAARNVISGNIGGGVSISNSGATNNVVRGNFIGTNAAGTAAIANGDATHNNNGVTITDASNNTIGGATAADRNIISGNIARGVALNVSTGSTTNNIVIGNYIGTDVTGTIALGNGVGIGTGTSAGVGIDGSNNTVTGNLISGGFGYGVNVSATTASGNAIRGNLIGTNVTGTSALGNATGGVNANGPLNTVGGTSLADRNVISGNNGTGVTVNGASANGNSILGNLIGTDKNGTASIPNVSIQSGINVTNGAVNTIVGGSAAGAGNVVSGNSQNAITVCCSNATSGTIVQGNFVGTDITGTVALANPGIGIDVVTAANTTIGGTAAGARNLVSGNGTGIQVRTGAVNTVIQGNLIGTNVSGTSVIPNTGRGIHIQDTSGHTIGGTAAGAGNTIRGNGSGVGVAGTSTGIAIRGNIIFGNSGIGIDLNEDGATANDVNDGDSGPNNLQNFPVLTAAAVSGGATTVDGTLNSGLNAVYNIDFFAGASCGAAQRYLGSVQTTTVGNDATFHATGLGDSTSGEFIMATATDTAGNTSEFSACQTTQTGNQAPVADAGADQSVNVGATVQLNGNGSSDPENATLTYSWSFVSRPVGSAATLTGPTTVTPTFVADAPGNFVVQLVVNDGTADSAPDTVTIHANQPPTANAGPDQNVPVGNTVLLDGSASSDPENATLSYSWILNTRPFGSTAVLSAANIVNPTFVADKPGTYIAQLVVNDGLVNSASDTVSITTQNQAPVANAGPDQSNITLGSVVHLDGSASQDPDGNSITYAWALVLKPGSSTATLTGATTATPTFVADVAGLYRARLVVNDGQVNSAADTVDLATVNSPPIANAGPDQSVAIGATVHLNGGGSSDPDGNPLGYSWSFTSKPIASSAVLTGPTTATPSFVADAAGPYVVSLTVNDGFVNSAPDEVTITVFDTIALNLVNTNLVGLGRTAALKITLPADAPVGGVDVTVASDNVSIVDVQPPNVVTIPEGTRIGQVTLNGVSVGTTIVRANGSGFSEGALTVTVTQNLVTVPATLNVPFTQTTAFPVSIGPNAAPAGGLSINVVSDNPAVVEVMTPTITIPQGAFGANATVRGATVGTATVTAGNANFSSASSLVTSSGSLNILQSSATFTPGFPTNVTVQLESAGSAVAAPPGGLSVTLTAANAGCLSVPSPVTIPAGLVNVSVALAYGGTASLPCTTTLTASGTSLTADAISVTVNPNPSITLFSLPTTVGAGLQGSAITVRLGVSNHGGVTVHLDSSNPAVVLLSPNSTTAGTATIDLAVANGQTDATYFVQGVEGVTGSATITASAPGFTNATGTGNVAQPGYELVSVPANTTSLSGDTAFYVEVGLPTANHAAVATVQNVRPGGGFTATVTNSNAAVAQLKTTAGAAQSRTVTIPAGQYYSPTSVASGGVAFDPLGAGTTTVSASIPGLIATTAASATATVTAPGITLFSLPITVGAGLQSNAITVRLGGSNHGGVSIHLDSSNPGVLLLSPNSTTAGTATIDLPVANGQTDATYIVQGVEGVTGSATITASAPGFTNATGTGNVAQPGYELVGVPATTTSLSANTAFYVEVGLPNANTTAVQTVQNVRPGGGLTVTATNSNGSVAQLTTTGGTAQSRIVTIPAGQYYSPTSVASGGVAFDPLGAGTTTVSASIPGLIATTAASATTTVTAPGITLFSLPTTVGSGLQTGAFTVRLGGSNHGGVSIHVESSNPGVLLLSSNSTTAGTASVDLPVANGQTDATYFVQGVEGVTGSATITASAPGFTNATGTGNVAQPGYELVGVPATTTSLSANTAFYVEVGLPNANTTALQTVQNVRPGGGLTVTVTNSNGSVAQLTTTGGTAQSRIVTIPAGQYYSPTSVASGGVAFDPISGGTTTVSASIPGLIATTAASATVTVTAPGITLFSLPTTVGSGLQTGAFTVRLGGSNHGGVSIHVESSNPGVLLLSPNSTTAGTASVDLPVANGQTDASYYVQGVEGATGTVTITASAPGFSSSTGTANVVQPALEIQGLSTSTTSLSANTAFYVEVGLPNANSTSVAAVQNVRPGSGLTATVINSNASVAQLTTSGGTAQSRTVTIPPGQYYSPTTVASGGVAFDPLAVGNTTVAATIPGYIATDAATVNVTVTSTNITLFSLPASVGAGLQTGAFTVRLGGSAHGGVSVHLVSGDASTLLLSPNATTAGTASIDLPIANGQTDATYYVQGVEGALGNVVVTASAPGFNDGTGTVSVVQPALQIISLPTSISATASSAVFAVRVGLPNGGNTAVAQVQAVRVGSTLLATVTNSTASAAQLVTNAGGAQSRTVTIAAGAFDSPATVAAGGIAFDPLAQGSTTVSATIPGVIATVAASVNVTITP